MLLGLTDMSDGVSKVAFLLDSAQGSSGVRLGGHGQVADLQPRSRLHAAMRFGGGDHSRETDLSALIPMQGSIVHETRRRSVSETSSSLTNADSNHAAYARVEAVKPPAKSNPGPRHMARSCDHQRQSKPRECCISDLKVL